MYESWPDDGLLNALDGLVELNSKNPTVTGTITKLMEEVDRRTSPALNCSGRVNPIDKSGP